jgi:signal transduction histidine kinase/CheY-like chemotaxis protein
VTTNDFTAAVKERFSTRKLGAIGVLLAAYTGMAYAQHAAQGGGESLSYAAGIALGILFLEGPFFGLAILVAACIAGVLAGWPAATLAVLPFAFALEASVGAALLRTLRVDPLFRTKRDALWLFAVAALVSLIVPTARLLLGAAGFMAPSALGWFGIYATRLASLVIVAPFVLRWLGKPRFSRTLGEVAETVAAFAFLFCALALFYGLRTPALPLMFLVLLPLAWIALIMRPRFVTLASLVLASAVLAGRAYGAAPLGMSGTDAELGLAVFAALFLLISSLEEEQRINANLAHSQVATMENAVARISSESSAKNDFIAMLAHELRNPLAPIASSIDLLRLKGRDDAEEREMLAMMDDRMQTVRRLLDDLLDISRMNEGKVAIEKKPVELGTVLRRAAVSTAHYYKEGHQALSTHFPSERLYVEGDAVRLEQVFSNLLANASKYSNSGGAVRLRLRSDGPEAEVTVSDSGVGIAPESIDAIFVPFHQTGHVSRTKKGLGIGLALVRNFVLAHGGTIEAKSAGIGKGSTFTVRLPLAEPPAAAPAGAAAPLPATHGAAGLRVLIVDDNDAAAGGLGKLLAMRGAQPEFAYNGAEGIEKAARHKPHVILLDIGLPDQDGYNVAKVLREEGFSGRLIALTGYSTDEAKRRVAASGFDDYLVKPAGLVELRKAIPELG